MKGEHENYSISEDRSTVFVSMTMTFDTARDVGDWLDEVELPYDTLPDNLRRLGLGLRRFTIPTTPEEEAEAVRRKEGRDSQRAVNMKAYHDEGTTP